MWILKVGDFSCVHTAKYTIIYIFTGIEDIELSSEERSYYMGRFGQSMVSFAQLKMADTVGKGIQLSLTCTL